MAKQIDDLISLDREVFEFSAARSWATSTTAARLQRQQGERAARPLAESWGVADDGGPIRSSSRRAEFASGTRSRPTTRRGRCSAPSSSTGAGLHPDQFGFTKDNVKERIKATDPETLVLVTEKAIAPSFLYYCLTANVSTVIDRKTVERRPRATISAMTG